MGKLTIILRALLTAAVLTSAAVSVHADERIPFARGGLKGGDWAFFRNYLLAEYPLIVKDVSEVQGLDRDGALEYMRRLMLYNARHEVVSDSWWKLVFGVAPDHDGCSIRRRGQSAS